MSDVTALRNGMTLAVSEDELLPMFLDGMFPVAVEDHGYETACWVWQMSKLSGGYGAVHVPGTSAQKGDDKTTSTHRYCWQFYFGEIPEGLEVLHYCHVRPCLRPGHLHLGTQADNIREMVEAGRANFNWKKGKSQNVGDENPGAKITAEDVLRIKAARAQGVTAKELVAHYDISIGQVGKILRGEKWGSVTGPLPELSAEEIDAMRGHRNVGEHNPQAKLTEAQVLEIRTRSTQGDSARSLAVIYGVSHTHIGRIVHGEKWRNTGQPQPKIEKALEAPHRSGPNQDCQTIEELFWEKVDKTGDNGGFMFEGTPCWLWTRYANNSGYGMFYSNQLKSITGQRYSFAHIFSWELVYGFGSVPDGMEVHHRCHVNLCVNPAHLELLTEQANSAERSRHNARGFDEYRVEDRGYETACFIWTGAKDTKGNPIKRVGKYNVQARRWSYELHGGVIPEGRRLFAACEQQDCVNPSHLHIKAAPSPQPIDQEKASRLPSEDVA